MALARELHQRPRNSAKSQLQPAPGADGWRGPIPRGFLGGRIWALCKGSLSTQPPTCLRRSNFGAKKVLPRACRQRGGGIRHRVDVVPAYQLISLRGSSGLSFQHVPHFRSSDLGSGSQEGVWPRKGDGRIGERVVKNFHLLRGVNDELGDLNGGQFRRAMAALKSINQDGCVPKSRFQLTVEDLGCGGSLAGKPQKPPQPSVSAAVQRHPKNAAN